MVRLKVKNLLPNVKLKRIRLPGVGTSVFVGMDGFAVFDKSVIKTNWSAINKGPIKRAGLLVRRIMRNSIRKVKSDEQRRKEFAEGKTKRFRRGKPSKPGSPPRSRSERYGHPFKKIYSVPFRRNTAVIVGHVGFYRKPKTAMSLHEFGQTTQIKEHVYPSKKRRKRRMSSFQKKAIQKALLAGKIPKRNSQAKIQTRTVKMPKRPFARPALEKAKPMIAKFWKDSVNMSSSVGGG